MRKISNKKDWEDFVADVEHFLGEDERNTPGCFGLSQNEDDIDGRFFTEFDCDKGDYYLVFKETGQHVWASSDDFIDGLTEKYNFPFFISDANVNYRWL